LRRVFDQSDFLDLAATSTSPAPAGCFIMLHHVQSVQVVSKLLFLQCEVPKISKLVNITPLTMVYGTYNYSYWGFC
jgi:hypothetical protein